jgi:NADH:ubiquinone reductase (H+-translocating)
MGRMRSTDEPQVVVLGAGFAGVSALRALADAPVRVTLVDEHPYNTFRPLLYQVATGGLNPGDITFPLRYLSARRHARYRRAKVTGIDHDGRRVLVDEGAPIEYDYLIIGVGSTTNHFGVPGAAEHTLSMYTRADALGVRDAIFGGVEKIAGQSATGTGRYTIVVVGGGPTGVEMAGAIAGLRSAMLAPTFPELNPSEIKVVLVEMMDALLLPFDKKLQQYTYRHLIKRGVDVRLGTAISAVAKDHVELKDGTSIRADLVIWAAGVAGHPEVTQWGLPLGRGGRIIIGDDLRVSDHDREFAVGDGAINPDNPMPQLSAPAIQMGHHAARQIIRLVKGEQTEPFHYHDRGIVATLGTNSAVIQLSNGLKFTGYLGWVGWVALHLWYLLGGRNRIETMINLSYRYMIWPKQTAAIIGDVQQPPSQRPEPADQNQAS